MFWEVDGASGEDASDGWFVGGDGWELGQKLARVNEESFKYFGARKSGFLTGLGARFGMTTFSGSRARSLLKHLRSILDLTPLSTFGFTQFVFNFFEGVGLSDFEFSYGNAAQGFQVRSAA